MIERYIKGSIIDVVTDTMSQLDKKTKGIIILGISFAALVTGLKIISEKEKEAK